MEIQQIAAVDIRLILDFIYGVAEDISEDQLHSLIHAASLLQVSPDT